MMGSITYFVLALLLLSRTGEGFASFGDGGGGGGGASLASASRASSSSCWLSSGRSTAQRGPRPRRRLARSGSSGATGYDFDTSSLWNRGLNFGKGQFKFYSGFESWMKPFPEQDRQAYPQLFQLPKGLYEITLAKPLGIVFEEVDVGRGLYVQDVVDGGNAQLSGQVQVGDVLVAMTAVKIVGAKYERRLIPARKFDFDTMVGAVESNNPKWGCDNVILMLERPDEADSADVDAFLRFFEPPFDNPWKQQQ